VPIRLWYILGRPGRVPTRLAICVQSKVTGGVLASAVAPPSRSRPVCWIESSHSFGAWSPPSGNVWTSVYLSTGLTTPPTRTWVRIVVRRLRDQKLGPWLVQFVESDVQFRSTGVSGQYSGWSTVNCLSEQVLPAGEPTMQRSVVASKSTCSGAGAE